MPDGSPGRRRGIVAQLQAQRVFIIGHAVADHSVILEHTAVTECGEHCVVEATGGIQITDAEGKVVQHADILAGQAWVRSGRF